MNATPEMTLEQRNMEIRRKQRARMLSSDWRPEYDHWRHGGWYVNVVYPSGACGCVSRNYPDKKWRVVCADQHHITYASRDAAAYAERDIAEAEWKAFDAKAEGSAE